MAATAAEQLAAHFTRLRLSAIPAKHVDDVKVLVRDYLGVALGGSRTDSGQIAAKFAEQTGGKAEATLIGHGGRVPAVHAAFANAIASHSIELDDVDILALFHFSPPVISAALAVAERAGASGGAFLTAAVAGCEMMARVSDATNPSMRNRAYHTTPTAGVFGAAIAAAHLLKLNEEQTVSALGMAGAQASGLMEMYGPSMQKRFNPGPAARNGVTAAVMAQLGFTGAATILDGERGFCRAFSDTYDIAKLTHGLGSEFPIFIEYKAYSCARPIHNAIDCALAVRRQMSEPTSAIRGMTMRRHPDWAHYHLNKTPQTYHEAQVSLPYSVAVALIDGAALLPQYQDERLHEPEILRLSNMLTIEVDPALPRGVSCHLTVETAGGARLTSQVDHPRGSIANPMTPEEMDRKVHMLADPVLGEAGVARVIEATERMEALTSIDQLTSLLAPGHA
jgi:2-methylcitrate dehydratase PrpD